MAVRIRLARHGRTHRPFYRVVVIDQRNQREGRTAEVVGTYDPFLPEKNIQVDIDRVHEWLEHGAQYSDALAALLKHEGYELYTAEQLERKAKSKAKRKAKRQNRKKQDGRFVKPSRRALLKHAKKLKTQRLAEEEAAAAAAAPAAAEEAAEADSASE